MTLMEKLIDPFRQEMAASLRGNQLFVKMPYTRVVELVGIMSHVRQERLKQKKEPLENLGVQEKFMREQMESATNPSIFISLTRSRAQEDVEGLLTFEEEDSRGILSRYRIILEKGLEDDPDVDWIRRMGGPTSEPFIDLSLEEGELLELTVPDPDGAESN